MRVSERGIEFISTVRSWPTKPETSGSVGDGSGNRHAVGRLATVRLARSTETDAPVIDLLFASSGIEAEVVAEAEAIELLPNLTMRVARIGHWIALKILSRDDVESSRPASHLRPRQAQRDALMHSVFLVSIEHVDQDLPAPIQ
jgi:hypothetical protein